MNSKMRILLVDDDKNMTRTLADILALADHTVQVAGSGREALEKVGSHRLFDCVLTDVRMPDMNGVELHGHLKETQPGLPVLLMTAYAAQEDIHKGLENGVVGVLEKPLDIGQLLTFFSALAHLSAVDVSTDDPNSGGPPSGGPPSGGPLPDGPLAAGRLARLRTLLHQSKG